MHLADKREALSSISTNVDASGIAAFAGFIFNRW